MPPRESKAGQRATARPAIASAPFWRALRYHRVPMTLEDLVLLSRRGRLRLAALVFAVVVAVIWASAYFLQPAPARRLVLASGPEDGLAHQYAKRYVEILARSGVTVEERITNGAGENLRLLQDPRSGVDIAFTQGGIAQFPDANDVVMLASLYYVPMWIFYRGEETMDQIGDLRYRRIAVGAEGGGTRAFAGPLLAINGLTTGIVMVPMSNSAALRALTSNEVSAAIFVDGAQNAAVATALRDRGLKLMSFYRADAYPRRFPYITKLTLPPGVIDFANDIPAKEVTLIGTKVMLAARDGVHPALVNLLVDAAQEIHGGQGLFERAGEFPGTDQVDLRVSNEAAQHKRFGPNFLHRYLPFWAATLAERAIVILLPLAAVLFPLFNYLPQFLRWRVRSRIYRWYGELAMLERDVATRAGSLPTEKWLADLDRIERAVAGIRTPTGFASEAYTLREHIGLVRRAVIARMSPLQPAA
jgi:TRAP-type uncharacterized transport system substrate-binding protein